MVVERRPYVPEHRRARQCRRDCTTSEISLRGGQQVIIVAFPQAGFESPGKVRRWLYGGKIPEE